MKNVTLHAAVVLTAAGILASCSSLETTSSSSKSLHLLTKQRAEAMMGRSGASTPTRGGYLPAAPSVALKSAAVNLPKDKHGMPTYSDDRQRRRYVRTTSYSHMENEPGAHGRLNASGTVLKYGMVRSAAADWSRYPVGTTFKIKGLPYTYVVDDYGSSLVGTNTIDIFHPSLSSMRAWATRPAEINVIHWGSLERTVNLLKKRTKYSHCARMYYAARSKLASGGYASAASRKQPAL